MAGDNVGYASLTVIPSAKGFKQALEGATTGPLRSAGASGGAEMGSGIMSGVSGILGPAMAALGAVAIGSFVKGTVAAAADLEQSVGAINSVFKDSAAQMHAFADTAATTLGLTKNEYNELGTLIGAQLKNAGVAMDELAPKTNELMTLGADLSSMFGGTTAEAVQALSSALKGERDPIERYGVSLRQAAIDAKAAELGFQKVDGALTSEANAAATLALIMEQTTDAHGNFARETDTLANRQQVLSALWGDAKARLGGVFLPAVTAAASGLIAVLGPAVDFVIGGLERLSAGITAAVDFIRTGDIGQAITDGLAIDPDSPILAFLTTLRETFDNILTAVGPALDPLLASLGSLAGNAAGLASSFSPLGIIFEALAPILPQLASLFAEIATILSDQLGAIFVTLQPIIEKVVSTLSELFAAILPIVASLVGALGPVLGAIAGAFMQILDAVLPLVSSLLDALLPAIMPLIEQVGPLLVQVFDLIATAIGPVIDLLLGVLTPVIEALLPVVTTVFGAIAEIIGGVMQAVGGLIQTVLAVLRGDWAGAWEGMRNILEGVWNAIWGVVSGVFTALWQLISGVVTAIVGIVVNTFTNVVDFIATVANNIWSTISQTVGDVIRFFQELPGKIIGAIGNLGTLLYNAGRDIIQGLINGIQSMLGAIGRAIINLVPKAIRGPFEALLGIASPSKVFREYGVNIGEGLALGIESMTGRVTSATASLATTFDPIESPTVTDGGLQGSITAAIAGFSASPVVGQLTFQSGGDLRSDLDETLFQLRRIRRGGAYA